MRIHSTIGVLALSALVLGAEEPGLGFAEGLPGWKVNLGRRNIQVVRTPFGSGIQVDDSSRTEACNLETGYLPAAQGGYELSGRIRMERDEGVTIKVRFYDAGHRELDMSEIVWIRTPAGGPWEDFSLKAYAAWPGIRFLKVFVYTWYETTPRFRLAALTLRSLDIRPIPPRWKPSFRNRREITADEMPGPDGIVYPDFTHAGLKAANVFARRVRLEEFGGRAAPGFDNYPALAAALRHLTACGGGELLLGDGVYELGHPVFVHGDGIAIRGQGPARTKILLRFSPGGGGIRFCWLADRQEVGPDTSLIAVAAAPGLLGMDWFVDGRPFRQWRKNASEGNCSSDFIRLPRTSAPGTHLIRAVAVHGNGDARAAETRVEFVPGLDTPEIPEKLEAAFLFSGRGFDKERILLAENEPRRGGRVLVSERPSLLAPGDLVKIEAPLTERWRRLVKCACRWGYFRDCLAEVEWTDGRRVGLTQPLRIDYPLADRPFLQKLHGIRNCEFTGLSFEQTENLWLCTVFFKYASNCRAADLRVLRSGRHPFFSYWSRNLEVAGCDFSDAWDRGGGGAGYVSWELTFDSLMDQVTTRRMRHAPAFQWASAGNVIRRSVFLDSDAQWHAGWTNNNLLEQCTIKARMGFGSYGHGMWASFPGDGGKGPNGPRNVVYNCDVESPLGSVWLGGMNENWIFCYNRFRAGKGPGVLLQNQAMETIVHGNVFRIGDADSPMVMFKTPDCTGVEITDNVLIGGSGFHGGLLAPEVCTGNRCASPDSPVETVAPAVAVPSIYEWQLQRKGIRR